MKYIYFGTKDRMAWVPAPAINTDVSSLKWSSTANFIDGGANVRNSTGSHKEYKFVWNLAGQADIYGILDYASGVYGSGLIYFIDPFASESNLLPAAWAAPTLAVDDAPAMWSARPVTVATPVNTIGLPLTGATYTTSTGTAKELFIPVPAGYTLNFGVYGAVVSGAPTVLVNGSAATLQTVASTVRTNKTATTDVTIKLGGSGVISIYGMIAQLRLTGVPVPAGGWISGRGHSGCRFQGAPTISGYSAALDKIGASATLVETGSWE